MNGTLILKNLAVILIAVFLVSIPVSAITTIENGGYVYAGEEHYNLAFVDNAPSKMFGWWASAPSTQLSAMRVVDLTDHNDVVFNIREYSGASGRWAAVDANGRWIESGPSFYLVVPRPPQPSPTPTPTPSFGSITISSNPSDAMVYIDNAVKGITPISVTVSNGPHTVRIRLEGYAEYQTSVTISGDTISISPELIPVTTPSTTTPTTVQTTTPTTVPTTPPTQIPTTEPTIEPTPEPESTTPQMEVQTVDYSETIAAMQSQIDGQSTQNANQEATLQAQAEQIAQQSEDIGILQQIINSILSFLGIQ